MPDIAAAVRALAGGTLVAYPTETVYGLGADATDPTAVDRVFALKGRDRDDPLSVAVGSVADATRRFDLTAAERRFLEAFCPGPVTLVCSRPDAIPPVVTGGRDRVGIRIPDHPVALALLDRFAPITATSANPSGGAETDDPTALADEIRQGVAVVLPASLNDIEGDAPDAGTERTVDADAGTDRPIDAIDADTGHGESAPDYEPSTVVDVERREIHRRGAMADAVETFLRESVS
jgi:L-threonylcarbamoyladenylate synthase